MNTQNSGCLITDRKLDCGQIIELLRACVWGDEVIVTDRSVDRCVTTLSAKIETDPHEPVFIQTIRDLGHRFELPEPVSGK